MTIPSSRPTSREIALITQRWSHHSEADTPADTPGPRCPLFLFGTDPRRRPLRPVRGEWDDGSGVHRVAAGRRRARGRRALQVFVYPGDPIIEFMEQARQDGIEVVLAGREGTAAFMAEDPGHGQRGHRGLRLDAGTRLDRARQRRGRGLPRPGADARGVRADRDLPAGLLHPPGRRPRPGVQPGREAGPAG